MNKRFEAQANDIVKYNGDRAKIISVDYCDYTNQKIYNIKELTPPYSQVRGIGAMWGSLEHYK